MVVGEAWLWLGGSLLLALLWTNLTWLFSPWADAERSTGTPVSLAERIVSRVANWRFAPFLYEGLRLLYYVGLPSAALFWGRDAVVNRFLGLQRLPQAVADVSRGVASSASWSSWAHDLAWATVLGLGSGGLLLLASFVRREAVNSQSSDRGGEVTGLRTAREAFYHEIHWAFYRNAPIVAFGSYWGTWGGLALVALEAALDPAWREKLREPCHAWSGLSQGALAVVSSVLFLQTENLWLALLIHWGIAWAFKVYVTSSLGPLGKAFSKT